MIFNEHELNTPRMHEWLNCETDFEENSPEAYNLLIASDTVSG
jgi:hypothetical protein